jgi:tripartite motif-containing protein 71
MDRLAVRRIVFGAVGACALVLVGCPSPFLARIKQEIANAPYTSGTYVFAREWGNAHPEWSFDSPVVKADSAGFVYVADNSFRIRKFNGSGSLQSTVAGVSTKGTQTELFDMAFDTSGNMYVTTNDVDQVQKYDKSGSLLASWGSTTDLYGTANVALNTPTGIVVDGSGHVFVADSINNRVIEFSSTGAFIAEWGGSTTYGTENQQLAKPMGLAIDGSNHLWVADENNSRLVVIPIGGGAVSTYGYGVTYGTGTLLYPTGIAIATVGFSEYAYIADSNHNRIVSVYTSSPNTLHSEWNDGGSFLTPTSIAVDTAGAVYVTDGADFSGRVTKWNVSATPTLSSTWTTAPQADTGRTVTPWGVVSDSLGNFWVSEIFNSRIERFDAQGNYSTVITGGSYFSWPAGLTIDAAGKIYVTDLSGGKYVVFDANGNYVATVGSAGSTDGKLLQPAGIGVDADGNVYVADSGNSRIQVFSPDGYYLRKWGSLGAGDGQFSDKGNYSIAVDAAHGWVYAADWEQNRVQKFDLNGTLLVKWGTFGTGNGQFNAPVGIAVDPAGYVYVGDMANHRVEKFDSNGNYLTTIGTVGAGQGGLGWALGVAADPFGNVAVTDYIGGEVQLFSPKF